MIVDKQWFIEAFDEYVSGTGEDGAALEKTRDGVMHAYLDALDKNMIERPESDRSEEGRNLFDKWVKPERTRRTGSMRKSFEHLLDALSGDTMLGSDDPVLTAAFPVGDGRDKTLAHWTIDDFQTALTERFRNAGAVTVAATQFDADAQRFIAAMKSRGVGIFGNLFGDAA